MTELSPQAQAVLDAADSAFDQAGTTRQGIAAALRAAADQCKIEWNYHPDYPETEWVIVVSDLLAIAAELEGGND
jgi:hypothetical protein